MIKKEEEESLSYPVCEKTRKRFSAWRRGERRPTRHSSGRTQQRDSGWPGTHKRQASKGFSVRSSYKKISVFFKAKFLFIRSKQKKKALRRSSS